MASEIAAKFIEGMRSHQKFFLPPADHIAVFREKMYEFISKTPTEPGVSFESGQVDGIDIECAVPDKIEGNDIIYYIHGGGFITGTCSTTRAFTSWLASESKKRVYSVSYRLAPEYKAPCAIEDCQKVYEWLLSEYPDEKITLLGDSAGGNLVLALTLKVKDEGIKLPDLVAAFSPVTGFAETWPSRKENEENDPIISGKDFDQMTKAYAGEDADLYDPYLSPVYGNFRGFPHMMIYADRGEVFFDDSRYLAEAAIEAGVQVEYLWSEGLFHAYPAFGGKMIPEAREVMEQVIARINQ